MKNNYQRTTIEHRAYLYRRLHAIEPFLHKNNLLTKTDLQKSYKGLKDLAENEDTLIAAANMFQVCGEKQT